MSAREEYFTHDNKEICDICVMMKLKYIRIEIVRTMKELTQKVMAETLTRDSSKASSLLSKLDIGQPGEPMCSRKEKEEAIQFHIPFDNILYLDVDAIFAIIDKMINVSEVEILRLQNKMPEMRDTSCMKYLPAIRLDNIAIYNCQVVDVLGHKSAPITMVFSGVCVPFTTPPTEIRNSLMLSSVRMSSQKARYMTSPRCEFEAKDVISLHKQLSYSLEETLSSEGKCTPLIAISHCKIVVPGIKQDTDCHYDLSKYEKFDITVAVEILSRCDLNMMLSTEMTNIVVGKIEWICMNIFFEKKTPNKYFLSFSAFPHVSEDAVATSSASSDRKKRSRN